MYHFVIQHWRWVIWNLFHNQMWDRHSSHVQIFTESRSQVIRNLPVSLIDLWVPDLEGCCFWSTQAAVVHAPETEWSHAYMFIQRQPIKTIFNFSHNLVKSGLQYCFSDKGVTPACAKIGTAMAGCVGWLPGTSISNSLSIAKMFWHSFSTGASSWLGWFENEPAFPLTWEANIDLADYLPRVTTKTEDFLIWKKFTLVVILLGKRPTLRSRIQLVLPWLRVHSIEV